MARRKQTIEVELPPDIEPTNEESDFFTFIDDIGPSTAVVEIYKRQKDGSQPHCERVSVDIIREDVFEYLRSTWGAGKYVLQFKGTDRRIKASKNIDIMGRPDPPTVPGVIPNGNGDRVMEQHLTFLREQNAKQETMLMSLISGLAGRAVPPAPDPAVMLTAVVTAFTSLKSAASDGDVITKMKPIIELARELQPDRGGDGDANFWTVARDVGKGIVEEIRAKPAALPPAPPRAGGIPPANPPADPPPADPPDWLAVGIAYLKSKARLSKPPANYVDWVLDNLEEPPCAAIHDAIQRGATLEHLLQFDREIAENPAYVSWFTQFLSEYAGALREFNPTVDSSGPNGNAGNLTGHASDGTEPT